MLYDQLDRAIVKAIDADIRTQRDMLRSAYAVIHEAQRIGQAVGRTPETMVHQRLQALKWAGKIECTGSALRAKWYVRNDA